ncbi:MAG TPA: hypothetical protein VFS84_04180 [Candidatus Binatia bacterium]|nr:hypothetical protein [Candidatus Binatia bacterium]
MPWEQTSAMDQRVQFISDWLSQEYRKDRIVHDLWNQSADR